MAALVTAGTVGCRGIREAFSAHAGVAASAAGQDLTVERLAGWVAHVKRAQPSAKNFTAIASLYVDYMLFAAQLAKGQDLHDSALVIRASWPTATQLRWNRFHDELFATAAHLTPAQVDSAYQAGNVRLLQHILIQVPASAAPGDVERKRVQTEQILRQVSSQHGTNFAALAKRYSEDPGSKARGGYLSAVARGQYVAPFETAGWELPPGGISGIVRSPFGFHLIRRPPLPEVRDSFSADVSRLVLAHLDSQYVNGISSQYAIVVDEGAPARVRQIFDDLEHARKDRHVLATYRGGSFRVQDLVRWLYAIDPEEARALPAGTDTQLKEFVTMVVERELLIQKVDSAHVALEPDDWAEIKADYDSGVARLQRAMGLSPELFRDSASTPEARVRLAATHVNNYLERALKGEARFVPLSPFLGAILREREPWSIYPAGIAAAVERAGTVRDSLRGAIRPAPGPAPVPLDTTPHRYVR
ncbi:MAG TPA: peptidylprolyl isomerase [Gemmatimonadales bacterium]|nr:peptidylprolyl isomerase [Gemmatimonadales bacterium]